MKMASYQKPSNTHELRQKIFTSIDKLSDRATFTQASSELNYLAKSLSLDFLPTFLSCILSIDSSLKSPVRVHCITLLSLLNQTHKHFLSPHLPKIIPFLLRRLRDSDSSVRNACVSAVTALSPLNYPPLLDATLGSISIEQDLNAQIGCCLCLKAAIDAGAFEEKEVIELRKRVLPKAMKLLKGDGFKAKGALLGVIESVVGVKNGVVINNGNNNGANLVGNVVGVAVEMLSSDDWMARKSAAELLLKMAVVVDEDSAAEVKRFVVNSLDSRRFDKVKVTREIMNRALEAWREVPGGPEALSRSNSSISKESGTTGGGSPPIPRRCSYAGTETPKSKKAMAKCRSSLSDGPVATISPSMSPSTQESIGLETPQRKETLSKSRSSLSDDSTVTDSSSVSKSSPDVAFEAAQSKRNVSKGRSSLPLKANDKKSSLYQNAEPKKLSNWKVELAALAASSETVESDVSSNFVKQSFEGKVEKVPKVNAFKPGSRVAPFSEEDEPRRLDFDGGGNEEVGESNADSEDLSLIRKQLLQIERQQSDMMVLIQRFMGNSQSGIDSLENRVSGLERALDEISHDLAVQSGRIANNDSAGSTCCPSTEFLSPKFWRRTEGRSSSIPKSSYSGSMPSRDGSLEAAPQMDGVKHHEQNEGFYRESWGSVKGIGQTAQRGRNCSPRSFDSASTAACFNSVVRGA
ncbi:TORTIFOLIA1-like protein 4 [Chenopodium quinoa]|uniref:TORTIFOLIA1-like protein 4 n=1 Tax=Chenopodium quinoa TaxID=63459 RepID=UPI000B76BBC1|nr:TORTIFOLIA1-like protein 4 [Chenopodium quinoa]